MEKEKEFLGFYVSGQSFDKYESLYRSFEFDELNVLKEEHTEKEVWLYGIVQEFKKNEN